MTQTGAIFLGFLAIFGPFLIGMMIDMISSPASYRTVKPEPKEVVNSGYPLSVLLHASWPEGSTLAERTVALVEAGLRRLKINGSTSR